MSDRKALWLQTLPCGCQDVHYSDGSIDYEHDHLDCDGSPEEGAPVLSEAVFDPGDGRVMFVTEWMTVPPREDSMFTVTEDHWRDEHPPVREVHAWRYSE